ncbi:Ribonuclease P/MRP protein subunit RPP1 [Candida tropicalis]
MSYDLNIPWPVSSYDKKPTPQELTNFKNTIITNYSLGITHQVLNFIITDSIKIPINSNNKNDINPIPIDSLIKEFKPKFPKLRLFTRITLIINDCSKIPSIPKLTNNFDIISIQPNNEKVFQSIVLNLEIDLISINLSNKLNFYLKFKTLHTAIEKGIKFEINYSQLISGNQGFLNNETNSNLIKKNFFNNVLQLIRGTRSNGLVISSGAQNPLQLRNLNDILILLSTLGLDKNKSRKFITEMPEKVLINGKLKSKSHRQTIVINDDEKFVEDSNGVGYKKKLEDSSSGRLLKKRKLATNS